MFVKTAWAVGRVRTILGLWDVKDEWTPCMSFSNEVEALVFAKRWEQNDRLPAGSVTIRTCWR